MLECIKLNHKALLAYGRWAINWAFKVAEFASFQAIAQLLGAVAGLLIVRALDKEEYALYAITFQMLTACSLLADLGIAIGVRSIGGRVCDDRRRFGELVKTALELRKWFAAFSLAACLPVTLWMLIANGADWPTAVLLCVVLIASVVPLLTLSVLTIVPQLHGEYRRIQRRDLLTAAVRIVLIGGLVATHISAILAAAVGAVGNWLQLKLTHPWAREHADPNAPVNAQDHRELVRLSRRQFPNTLFYCFQGQVTLVVLSWFGNSRGVAEITALGRLAMLLTVFSITYTNVLVPRFARCRDRKRLKTLFITLLLSCVLCFAPIVLLGVLAPGPLLWILGEAYEGLNVELVLALSAATLNAILGVIHSLNLARGWVLRPAITIPTALGAQVLAVLIFDVSQVTGLLCMQVLLALVGIAVTICFFVYKFRSLTN